jgi:hypothetical protein
MWKEPLRVTAKSGFLTKEIFKEFMFGGKTRRGANLSWANLKESGLFKVHPNPRLRDVLVLNRHNKIVQTQGFNSVATTPNEAVMHHDEILLHGVLDIENHGFLHRWILEPGIEIEGLQEFKISSQGNKIKYPDAVLEFKDPAASRVAALELELTQKDGKRYDQILSAYSSMEGIALVLFITGSKTIEKAIERHAKESFYPMHGQQLGFMTLQDWQEGPLLAHVRVKDRSQTLGTWATISETA